MVFCKNCGANVEPGTKFCETCGAAVDDKPVTPPPQAPVIKETPATQPPGPRKKPMAIPHLYLIVGIVVVVIIIAALLASGVLSISVTATTKDKIIGKWRHTDPEGLDARFMFNANGSLVGSGYSPHDKGIQVLYGSWKAQGNSSYEIIWTDGSTFRVVYDPARNVIYDPKYPDILLTPYQGDMMADLTPAPTVKVTTVTATTMTVPGSGSAMDWNSKGIELFAIQDYSGALYTYEKAISLNPDSAIYWRNKGTTLNSLERYSEALIAADKAISLDPQFALAWSDKGIALGNLGRYSEALIADEKAISLDPGSKYSWNAKGWHLEKLNRYQEALTAYETAIALDPAYQRAIDNKKNLEAKLKT